MNKILLGLCLVVVIQEFANAVESVMCNYYYQNVQRKVNNIQNNSNNLSSMAKQKLYEDLIFDATTKISAKNLNLLGSQYESGKYLVDNHNHENEYYTKEEADLKYFSSTFPE